MARSSPLAWFFLGSGLAVAFLVVAYLLYILSGFAGYSNFNPLGILEEDRVEGVVLTYVLLFAMTILGFTSIRAFKKASGRD